MNTRKPEPLFLERQVYMRRRLGDAAKILPVVALGLFLLPILWASEARTAGSAIYLFLIWGLMIIAIAIVSSRLAQRSPGGEGERGDRDA